MKPARTRTFLFLLLAIPAALVAQPSANLYLPAQIRQAIAKQTRSLTGQPGKNYFQNRASYELSAAYEPASRMLTGTGTITYVNNSPDSLKQLCFNLFQDVYKKGSPRNSNVDEVNIHDGVEISSLSIGGVMVPADKHRHFSTIMVVPLPKKMAPGATVEISIGWKQKMPVTAVHRQGTYHGSSHFIAYWYPKIGVYDDIEGWNTAGYQGQAEFYSDYADYRVAVTVPSAYTVWSSGTLLNAAEVYQQPILERMRKASVSDSVIRIIAEGDRAAGKVVRSGESLTWRFALESQMDFAFGLSDTYLWDATSALAGNRRVEIHSVYHPDAVNCPKLPGFTQHAVQYYSEKIPAIPYPEKQITLFEGGQGGMEFPGIINQQDFKEPMEAMMVAVHELGHAYLPFYAGINETKYGWIDEGIFTLVGILAFCDQAGDKDQNFLQMLSGKYGEDAASEGVDVPVMLLSHKLGDFTYGFTTYVKPATAFLVLYDYLGAERFTRALQEFLVRWKGLHPTPYDLFNTFGEAAGESLDWFWKPWFFEYGYADLAISAVENSSAKNTVTITNEGGYPLPVNLTVRYADGTEKTISKPMSIWKTGEKAIQLELPAGKIGSVELNSARVPETDYRNNKSN